MGLLPEEYKAGRCTCRQPGLRSCNESAEEATLGTEIPASPSTFDEASCDRGSQLNEAAEHTAAVEALTSGSTRPDAESAPSSHNASGICMTGSQDRGGSHLSASSLNESEELTGAMAAIGLEAKVHETGFGVMADLFQEAAMLDDAGVLQDVCMETFLLAAQEYRRVLSSLGTVAGLALADFDSNFQPVKSSFESDELARRTLRSYLQIESNSGGRAIKLQWLLRGLEFFLTYLKLTFEGSTHAASRSYQDTISKYHSWKTSLAFKAVLLGLPSKYRICGMVHLCPEVSDKRSSSALICRDVLRTTTAALPLVNKMVEVFRELGLWDSSKV